VTLLPSHARKRATIVDLAALCGVSKSTVSKALGISAKHYEVSAELRNRIRRAAMECGYCPDRLHQRRRGGQSMTVAMLFSGTAPVTFGINTNIPCALGDVLYAAGYMLIAIPTLDHVSGHWERLIRDIRPDGCLLMPPQQPGLAEYLSQAGRPTVIINGVSEAGFIAVEADDAGGAQLAVDHLLALGHRRIAYFNSRLSVEHYSETVRAVAVAEALCQAGAEPPTVFRSALQLRDALRNPRQRPTAVIAYSESEAFEVMAVVRHAGLTLPKDLSLICFNNSTATELTTPALTVVNVPTHQMAVQAAHLLLAEMSFTTAVGCMLPEHLVIRESTAVPHRH
jgi:LacI family transcriptional regulator